MVGIHFVFIKEKWSALYDVRTILLSIQSLLAEPNNDSPLNVDAAELWENQAGTCVCVCVCVCFFVVIMVAA